MAFFKLENIFLFVFGQLMGKNFSLNVFEQEKKNVLVEKTGLAISVEFLPKFVQIGCSIFFWARFNDAFFVVALYSLLLLSSDQPDI